MRDRERRKKKEERREERQRREGKPVSSEGRVYEASVMGHISVVHEV